MKKLIYFAVIALCISSCVALEETSATSSENEKETDSNSYLPKEGKVYPVDPVIKE